MRGKLARSSLQTGAMPGLRTANHAALLMLAGQLGPIVYVNSIAAATLAPCKAWSFYRLPPAG